MPDVSRRKFLGATAATTLLAAVDPWTNAHCAEGYKSPNDQPVIGFIGCGIRFHSSLGPGGTNFGPCAAVADVDMVQAGRAVQKLFDRHREKNHPLAIDVHEDYRHVLDNKDIDIVFIATPDHWHAKPLIEAMKADKDVYCEKPLTLTIEEGRQIEQVMEETGRIVQVGTQQRTEFNNMFANAAAIARDGRAGKIKTVTTCIGGSRTCDPLPVAEPPISLNWDRWLGQSPMVDYRSHSEVVDTKGWGAGHPLSRAHRYYRWFYEYSGGKLTDWGAHHVDIAMLGLDKLRADIGNVVIDPVSVVHPVEFDENGMPTSDDRFNCATEFTVKVIFEDGVELHVRHNAEEELGFENGIMFHGDKGRFLVTRGKLVGKPVEDLADNPLPTNAHLDLYGQNMPNSHIENFIECVNAGIQPISDVKSHNFMLNICHAINIAMRLNRKLVFDPANRQFVDDDQANSFVSREQRKGYEIQT